MRERTARLIESLLIALVRALLPADGRHRAAPPPQPPALKRPLPPTPPARPCRCERERILQRRRAHWAVAYGTTAAPRQETPA
ncbi:hypothetical protein GCM10018780_84210 [Streptomyces lanatus]|nr:hypothetical protein GCM10018780_84210 [Streptomyces lanatus]